MKRKSETFEKFKEFMVEVENQLGKCIKAIRSDRSGEYLLEDFKDYLRRNSFRERVPKGAGGRLREDLKLNEPCALTENRIISQLTAPGTPQQNGVVERRNRTLSVMVRSMMSYSTLPIFFWGYALNTTMCLLNLVRLKSVPKILVELWNGRKPSMRHLHI